MVLKELIFNSFYMVVMKELIFTFLQVVVALKELIFNSFYFGQVWWF